MFRNKAFFRFFLLFFILFFAREIFAQEKQSSDDLKQAEQATSSQALSPVTSALSAENEEHVIAHQHVQNNELSLNELRSIFSLRARKWPDGTAITVFVLRDEHEVHRQFLLQTLKMLPHQLRRQWDRFIYSGIGQGPNVVKSQADMLQKIQATPGGIGYIEGEEVLDDSVHTLSIR